MSRFRKNILLYVAGIVTGVSLLVLGPTLLQSPAFAQQSGCRTFKETGKTVCGKFLQYWQQHGGLMQNGLPISNEFPESSPLNGRIYTVQYFERAVFEMHPENKAPYDVLLSQLGTYRFQERYNGQEPASGPISPLGTPVPVPTAQAGKGVITGRLRFPSEIIPAQEICALEVNGSRHYCVSTEQNQPNYVLAGVDPGTYYLVSYGPGSKSGDPGQAGYTRFVQCGSSVSCNDHALAPVSVKAGEVVDNIEVSDFYGAPAGGYPRKP